MTNFLIDSFLTSIVESTYLKKQTLALFTGNATYNLKTCFVNFSIQIKQATGALTWQITLQAID